MRSPPRRQSVGTVDHSQAILELRYRRIRVLPPIGKQQRYPETTLYVIHAHERGTPKGRERIEWKLLTDLPVTSRAEAIEKLTWYALRWKIETFHKILKSGCKAEDSKLRTAERLLRLLAVFCVLSWRIFWMTMINRSAPRAPAAAVFTTIERRLLDHLVPDRDNDRTLGARRRLVDLLAKASEFYPERPSAQLMCFRDFEVRNVGTSSLRRSSDL